MRQEYFLTDAEKIVLIKILFRLLKPAQSEMFKLFFSRTDRKLIIHCARRLGKTYFLCVISLIFAYRKPNSQIRYASVTQKAVRKMVRPIFKEIFLKLPVQYRGKWNSQEGAYIFNNGSMIHIAGVNNGHEDDLRGTAADLCIIDEAAFIDRLNYLTESVLMPQLLTVPNARLIMASSSPISPAHHFTEYIHTAKKEGNYAAYDIYAGNYAESLIAEFCKEAGGEKSTTWRREYLNELIVDSEFSIIPEWKDEFSFEFDKTEDENYEHHHKYWALDIGVRDKTIGLGAHYNFPEAKLYIEDEFELSGPDTTTRNISKNFDDMSTRLEWKEHPHLAVADNNNLILLQDLSVEYDKYFIATTKESLAAMINEVRLFVRDGRLIVHPRCTQLIGCLQYGVFQDVKRKEFGRSKAFGHYDALAALIYLIRNLDQTTNPIPIRISQNQHFRRKPKNANHEAFKKIFGS